MRRGLRHAAPGPRARDPPLIQWAAAAAAPTRSRIARHPANAPGPRRSADRRGSAHHGGLPRRRLVTGAWRGRRIFGPVERVTSDVTSPVSSLLRLGHRRPVGGQQDRRPAGGQRPAARRAELRRSSPRPIRRSCPRCCNWPAAAVTGSSPPASSRRAGLRELGHARRGQPGRRAAAGDGPQRRGPGRDRDPGSKHTSHGAAGHGRLLGRRRAAGGQRSDRLGHRDRHGVVRAYAHAPAAGRQPDAGPGQNVVTFASVLDRPFVPGVPIGQISKVQGNAGSLTPSPMVRPFADFTSLGVVGIVIVPPLRSRVFRAAAQSEPADRPHGEGHARRHPVRSGRWAPASPEPGRRDARRSWSRRGRRGRPAAQLAFVNRLALPGGGGPDLVLLVVVALALSAARLPARDRLPGRPGTGRRAAGQLHDRPLRAGVLPGRIRLRPAARRWVRGRPPCTWASPLRPPPPARPRTPCSA